MSENEVKELITKETIRKTIADNFRYLRGQLGLSQTLMAEKVGESRQNYGAVEDGRNISLHMIVNMARFCKVSLDNIILNDLSKQG